MREYFHVFCFGDFIVLIIGASLSSRPENLTRPYTIGTTFPNRTLDDDSATIQGSGLVNSVVVQRWL
jgi:hypothetical protein